MHRNALSTIIDIEHVQALEPQYLNAAISGSRDTWYHQPDLTARAAVPNVLQEFWLSYITSQYEVGSEKTPKAYADSVFVTVAGIQAGFRSILAEGSCI